MKILLKILLLLSLSSCSSFNQERIAPNYFNAYKALKDSIYGLEDYPISRALVDKIPYASIKVKVGKGGAGLMILEEINNDQFIYLSADGVRFVIKEGKITRSSGFKNNLTRKEESSYTIKSFLESRLTKQDYVIYHSYDEPNLVDLKLNVSIKRKDIETHQILGISYDLIKVEEIIQSQYLGWKRMNIYWVSSKDYFVWKSEQHLSPLLPIIKYEVTKKPTY
tara:strand:+ start:719 stop:1387 length:669 start_codon:yes stop_codon:yes gene_type:complete